MSPADPEALYAHGQQAQSRGEPAAALTAFASVLSALDEPGAVDAPLLRAAALLARGNLLHDGARLPEALESLKEAATLFRELGREDGEASAFDLKGLVLADLDRPREAFASHRAAIDLRRNGATPEGLASALNNAGRALLRLGQKEGAYDYYLQALAAAPDLDPQTKAQIVHNVYEVLRELGDPKAALERVDEMLSLAPLVDDSHFHAECLRQKGELLDEIAARDGSPTLRVEALKLIDESLDIWRSVGYPPGELRAAQQKLGVLVGPQERIDTASVLKCLSLLARIHEAGNDPRGQAPWLLTLAHCQASADRTEEALETLRSAQAVVERIGESSFAASITKMAAEWEQPRAAPVQLKEIPAALALSRLSATALSMRRDTPDVEALRHIGVALAAHEALVAPSLGEAPEIAAWRGELLLGRGILLKRARRYGEAVADFYVAASIMRRLEKPERRSVALDGAARALGALGQPLEALRLLDESREIAESLGDLDSVASCLEARADITPPGPARLELLARAAALYREADNVIAAIEARGRLGRENAELGDGPRAQAAFLAALEECGDNRELELGARVVAADSLTSVGQHAEAEEHLRAALEAMAGQEWPASVRYTLHSKLGGVLSAQRRPTEARAQHQLAFQACQELEDLRAEPAALNNIGVTYAAENQLEEAFRYYREALPLRRAAGDLEGEGSTLHNIGVALERERKWDEALPHLEDALVLRRASGDRPGELLTLDSLASVLEELGRNDEAREHRRTKLSLLDDKRGVLAKATEREGIAESYERTNDLASAVEEYEAIVGLLRQTEQRRKLATALHDVARVAIQLRRPAVAREAVIESLELARAEEMRRLAGHCLHELGQAEEAFERPHQALAAYQEGRALAEAEGDQALEAKCLNDMATVEGELQRPNESFRHLQEALALRRELGDRKDEARTLNNIGTLLNGLGARQEAGEYFEASLALRREQGDRRGEAITLANIAVANKGSGPAHAVSLCEKALAIIRELGEDGLRAELFDTLASFRLEAGEVEGALEDSTAALALHREHGRQLGEARSLGNISHIQAIAGQYRPAVETIERAIACYSSLGRWNELRLSYAFLGSIHSNHGNAVEALGAYALAVTLTETLRSEIAVTDFRTAFFAESSEIYGAYAAILASVGDAEAAFNAAQQSKARALSDTLSAEPRRATPAPPEGPDEQADRYASIAETMRRLAQVERDLVEAGMGDGERAAVLEAERSRLVQEIASHEASIRLLELGGGRDESAPRLPSRIVAVTPEQARASVIEDDVALLEYVCSKKTTLLFCLTSEDFGVFRLGAYDEIERMVDELRTAVTARLTAYPHGHDLYQRLIAPAAHMLRGKKRLLICPDGPLNYLPFPLLLTEPPGEHEFDWPSLPYLLHGVPGPDRCPLALSLAPSVHAAHEARRQAESRPEAAETGGRTILAIAYPGDSTEAGGEPADVPVEARAGDATRTHALFPIPWTVPEAWTVASVIGGSGPVKRAGEEAERFDDDAVTVRVGQATTKEEVSRLCAESSYRFVHIATHGVLNDRRPELSGLLLAGEEGDGADYWQAYEIARAHVRCELATLSCCDTALGRNVAGEGIIGLVRSFHQAGAEKVCATLWRIDDDATLAFMERFYAALAEDMTPELALLAAQRTLMSDGGSHAHPCAWGAFGVWV